MNDNKRPPSIIRVLMKVKEESFRTVGNRTPVDSVTPVERTLSIIYPSGSTLRLIGVRLCECVGVRMCASVMYVDIN